MIVEVGGLTKKLVAFICEVDITQTNLIELESDMKQTIEQLQNKLQLSEAKIANAAEEFINLLQQAERKYIMKADKEEFSKLGTDKNKW